MQKVWVIVFLLVWVFMPLATGVTKAGKVNARITNAREPWSQDLLSRLSKSVVDDINKLTPETRTKILNDIAADANFEKYVNDNPLISKAFTAHKNDLTESELAQIDELLKSSNIPAKAKFWANRGMKLRNMLKQSKLFDDFVESIIQSQYNGLYDRQVTMKITQKSNPNNVKEIVPDYFVNQNRKFTIVDSKFTTKEMDDFVVDDALTKNQDEVFQWFKDGDIGSIELRANSIKSERIGLYQGYKLKSEEIQSLEVHIIKSKADRTDAIEKIFKLGE